MSKFCKICKDSRKSNSVVHSHNVRERGRVVCPTLLATECRFCKKKGHTPKFCPKLKERESRVGAAPRNGNFRTARPGQRRNIHIAPVKKTPPPLPARAEPPLIIVNDDDDDDDDDDAIFILNFPPASWGDGPGESEPFQLDMLNRAGMHDQHNRQR